MKFVNKITSENGWINPAGKFYPCGYGGHTRLAYDIVGKKKLPSTEWGLVKADDFLEFNGWIKVQKSVSFGRPIFVRWTKYRHLREQEFGFEKVTKEQKETIKLICLTYKHEFVDIFETVSKLHIPKTYSLKERVQ